MKLSIIVPVYNVEKYLESCVSSLYQQDLDISEYEVILVNDGSIDGSRAIALSLQQQHPNLKLIDQENQGLSGARNTGIIHAQGDYIMFLDSDDYIAHDVLNELYTTAINYDCDILFFSLMLLFENGSTKLCENFPNIKRHQVYSGMEFFRRIDDYGGSVKAIYRRSFINSNKIAFTPRIIREDCDFGLRVYPMAKSVVVTDIPVYYYRKFGESLTRTKNIEKLRNNLFCEFFIMNNVINFIKDRNSSKSEITVYKHKLNSMFVGTFLTLVKNREEYGKAFFCKCVDFCLDNKIVPVFGKTDSWKTTIIFAVFNLYFLSCKLTGFSRYAKKCQRVH